MSGSRRDDSLLTPFRVLDLTGFKGRFCGKILADLGADVIKIEPPEGDPVRRLPPFYKDIEDPEKSLLWYALNGNKRGITLDLEGQKDQDMFRRLAATADFVIESFAPGYLDRLGLGYEALSEINQRLVFTSITPYGQTGPYRDYMASDLELMAMGGFMYLRGDPDRAPVRISCPQAHVLAGAEAAIGTMIAHYCRQRTGEGQHVDVSMHESITTSLLGSTAFWEFYGTNEHRNGAFVKGTGTPVTGYALQRLLWPCKDGYVPFIIQGDVMGWSTKNLVQCMDAEGMATDDLKEADWIRVDMALVPQEMVDRWSEPIGGFFLKHTRAEIYEMALKNRIALYPEYTVEDILKDRQLLARDYWTEIEHPELKDTMTYPGAFVGFSKTPSVIRRRAPLIGEHNKEVEEELRSQEAHGFSDQRATISSEVNGAERDEMWEHPLRDVKVADFTWMAAGPLVTKYLADYGAQVVRIESLARADFLRFAGPFKNGIRGINRSPKWAGYNGQTGPYAKHPGTGFQLTSLTSHTFLTGWPDREPSNTWPYTDVVAAMMATVGLIAAIDYRDRTRVGQYLDLSQYEASIHSITPHVLDYTANGRIGKRDGNHSVHGAPHGAYPCKGENRWCAIAVFTEEAWNGFCRAVGNPSWTEDTRFSTLAKRKENEDQLDALISEWTRQFTAEEIMHRMQEAGVGAGVVQTGEDLHKDPQLKHRRHFQRLHHQVIGDHCYYAPGFRFSRTPTKLRRAAPCLGEHNQYVFTKILGHPEDEFEELKKEGAIQ